MFALWSFQLRYSAPGKTLGGDECLDISESRGATPKVVRLCTRSRSRISFSVKQCRTTALGRVEPTALGLEGILAEVP